jgi:hypothetical protein
VARLLAFILFVFGVLLFCASVSADGVGGAGPGVAKFLLYGGIAVIVFAIYAYAKAMER